jgi:predicted alpha/beta hydrolase
MQRSSDGDARGMRSRTTRPKESASEIEVRTDDGHALRGVIREPDRGTKLVGVCVLAHAMFARKSEFERPKGSGLSRFLVERGWRTIAFDFRGHGDSGPDAASGGSWSYDDFVKYDLPAVVACARARAKKVPVIVVGHSLGGHVALASQGCGHLDADAIVCFAANVWARGFEPSRARWAVKRVVLAAMRVTFERRGYFPARTLKLGSDDEAVPYMAAMQRYARSGVWGSDDGAHNYGANLARVAIPVMQITSDGDLLNCHPECGELFLSRVAGPKEMVRMRRADDGGRAPGHMEMVTTERVKSAWKRAETWMRAIAPKRR